MSWQSRATGGERLVGLALLFDEDAPLEDRLSDQGDHDRVMTVMVKGVAVGDPLDHQLGSGSGGRGVIRLPFAEDVW